MKVIKKVREREKHEKEGKRDIGTGGVCWAIRPIFLDPQIFF